MRSNFESEQGKVWLVGAGPGVADLLTVRALRVIQAADVIFYDALVGQEIKALFPSSASCIYVGKRKGCHALDQAQLNQMLVDQARSGLRVCRLKGGDPSVFGRVGEEGMALAKAGVTFEIVPGVSSANGIAAFAGIPLTHRGLSQSCTLVSMHSRKVDGVEQGSEVNWQALVASHSTLVFYMGLSRAQLIQTQLLANGMAESTPAAVIAKGCTSEQQVFAGELSGLHSLVLDNAIPSPALIIVGQVVSLREQLNWFDGFEDQSLLQQMAWMLDGAKVTNELLLAVESLDYIQENYAKFSNDT